MALRKAGYESGTGRTAGGRCIGHDAGLLWGKCVWILVELVELVELIELVEFGCADVKLCCGCRRGGRGPARGCTEPFVQRHNQNVLAGCLPAARCRKRPGLRSIMKKLCVLKFDRPCSVVDRIGSAPQGRVGVVFALWAVRCGVVRCSGTLGEGMSGKGLEAEPLAAVETPKTTYKEDTCWIEGAWAV